MDLEQNPLAVVARFQTKAPVDLDGIARELNIPVEYINLGEHIAGMIVRDPRRSPSSGFVIRINNTQHKNRQRFTLAHELSHYILHRDLIESGLSDDTMYRSGLSSYFETQANRMAADILMPVRLVKKRFEENQLPDLLAKEFGVSRAAMDIRLSGIGGLSGQREMLF